MVRITSSGGSWLSESTEFKMVAGRVMDITYLERLPSNRSSVIRFFLAIKPHNIIANNISICVNVC